MENTWKFAEGVAAAAALIESKAKDYAERFGSDDLGSLSFGSGEHAQTKKTHYNTLIELASIMRETANTAGLLQQLERLQELSVTNIMLEVIPGPDGEGQEVFAESVEDVREVLSSLLDEVEAAETSAEQWRSLALQFDRHRMKAMAMLRGVAEDTTTKEDCAAFIALPPPPPLPHTVMIETLRSSFPLIEQPYIGMVAPVTAAVRAERKRFHAVLDTFQL